MHTEALLLFENVSEQHKFIQRVYGLLCLMVLLTSILTTVVMFVPVVGTWIKVNWYLMVIAMLLDIVFIIILCCVKVVGRTFPWNVIVLLCLVSTHNYVMAFVCAWFEIKHILIAFGITAGVIGVLTLFAFRSTCDFTSWRPYLVIVFLLLVLLGLCACFFWSWILDIFFCSVGVAVLCIIIVYDTQLVIGGKHRQAVLPSEYIFGAVILYLDVCLLFIFVLSLVGLTNN